MLVQDGIKSQTTTPAIRKVRDVDFFVPVEIQRISIYKFMSMLTLSSILLEFEVTYTNS